MSVKRYFHDCEPGSESYLPLGEHPEGMWVTYADHAAEVARLQARVRALEAARIAYASEFDGDVGSIHENIRKMKAHMRELQAALRLLWNWADDSIGSAYGTLSAKAVLDTTSAALAAVSAETEDDDG